jgi:hypothetical protein
MINCQVSTIHTLTHACIFKTTPKNLGGLRVDPGHDHGFDLG